MPSGVETPAAKDGFSSLWIYPVHGYYYYYYVYLILSLNMSTDNLSEWYINVAPSTLPDSCLAKYY